MFQTLIGTVKSTPGSYGEQRVYSFQTLIGTVKRGEARPPQGPLHRFQTLIGTVKRRINPRSRPTCRSSFKPS